MDKLRSSLESHKFALKVALDLKALLLIYFIKYDTKVIRDATTSIRQDTSQIVELV